MKTTVCLYLALFCGIAQANAQSSSQATVSATIVSPVGTSKINDLEISHSVSTNVLDMSSSARFITARNSLTINKQNVNTAAAFKVTANAMFDVSLQQPVLTLVNAVEPENIFLETHLNTTTTNGESYIIIGGHFANSTQLAAGNYRAETPLLVTIYFN